MSLDALQCVKKAYDPVKQAFRVTGMAIAPAAHASSHEAGGSDPILGDLDANARVELRVNGSSVGTRRAIHVLAGAAILLVSADDAGNEETELGIAVSNLTDAEVAAGAAIQESKLALNFPTHAQVHELAGIAGLGADHTVSGLTPGQVLKATGATTALFGALLHSELAGVGANDHHAQIHVLATTAGLGVDHTVSGLTAGQVLRASGAAAAAFAVLGHGDLGGVTADQHHAQAHVLATTAGLGADHTTSGLTAGMVLRATGAAAAAFQALVATDLPVHVIATNLALGAQHSISGATAGHVLRASSAVAANFQQLLYSELGSIPSTFAPTAHASAHQMGGADQLGSTIALGLTSLNADFSTVTGAAPGFVATNAGTAYQLALLATGANATGVRMAGIKTRGTSSDANTIVANADDVLSLEGWGADGAAFRLAASIRFVVAAAPGLGSMPGKIVFSTCETGGSGAIEAWAIDQIQNLYSVDGRLLVGASTHDADITAVTSSHPYLSATGGSRQLALIGNQAIATGPQILAFKTRSASGQNANAGLSVNDNILEIIGYGADGAAYQPAAQILIEADGTVSAGDMPGRITFWTTPDTSATPAEVMRISNNARVGILVGNTANSTFQVNGNAFIGAESIDGDIALFGTPQLIISGNNAVNYGLVLLSHGNNSSGPVIVAAKTRETGGTGASTAANSGDTVLSIQGFLAANGVYNECARIEIRVDGAVGSGDAPGSIHLMTSPDATASAIERVRVDNVGSIRHFGAANGQQTTIQMVTTSVTTSAAPADAANLIPAGSLVLGVTARVTTTITGTAATWDLGTVASPTLWGSARSKAASTIADITTFTALTSPLYFAVATTVRIRAVGGVGTFTGGVVRLTVHYISLVAPTS